MTTPTSQRADGPGIFEAIGRYRYAVAGAALACSLAGFFGSTLLPTTYAATASFIVGVNDFTETGVGDPERTAQLEANRLTSRAVWSEAAREVADGVRPADIAKAVALEVDTQVGLIEITAISDQPQRAASTANAVVKAYQAVRRQAARQQADMAREVLSAESNELRTEIELLEGQGSQVAQDQVEALRAQLSAMDARASQLITDVALSGVSIQDVELALPPEGPAGPNPLRNAALGGVIGTLVASAVAYWRTDVAERSRIDLETMLGAPLLAQIPRFSNASGDSADPFVDPDAAEAFQFLLSSVEFVLADSETRSLLVTSALPGEGKSSTALHLARTLAVQGRDVVLIDSDIRGRGLTLALQGGRLPGLVDVAEGNLDVSNFVRRYQISSGIHLPVLPAGQPPAQPTGLLASETYRDAIGRAIAYGDLAVVDSAPLLTVADASAVASQVDGLMLVLDADAPRDNVLKLRERLRLIPTPLVGFVLNRVSSDVSTPYPYKASERSLISRIWRGGKGRRPKPSEVAIDAADA